jgi:hypothetical protein
VAVYSENHMKHIHTLHTLYEQTFKLLIAKQGVKGLKNAWKYTFTPIIYTSIWRCFYVSKIATVHLHFNDFLL